MHERTARAAGVIYAGGEVIYVKKGDRQSEVQALVDEAMKKQRGNAFTIKNDTELTITINLTGQEIR